MVLDIRAKNTKFVGQRTNTYMANLSKIKRDQMIAFLESLKESHSDDASIQAFNEIENHIRDKKYGLVWEEHSEEVDELLKDNIPILTADPERKLCKNESYPWSFIIEGDNLQGLYLLEKTHRGKIDCIYIDPPYNTGARDWKYNNNYVINTDEYRHSKWLSMMKNRLLLAKNLLNPRNSALICSIDEKESLRLGNLLEELFPEATIEMVTSVISAKGVYKEGQFSRVEEYLYYVRIGDSTIQQSAINMLDSDVRKESEREIDWLGLRRREPSSKREARPNQFYPIYVDNKKGSISGIGDAVPYGVDRESIMVPPDCTALWPLDGQGRESLWGLTPEVLRRNLEKGYVRVKNWNAKKLTGTVYYLPTGTISDIESGVATITGYNEDGSVKAFYKEQGTVPPRKVWYQKSHNAETYGTNIVAELLPGRRFPYPKSVYAVLDSIRFVVGNNPDAVVLDFFAGSGTTLHAVNLLNCEDGGHRKCILVTNNELSFKEEDEFERRGIARGSKEWEDRGIARYITWPRSVCSINGHDINGKELKGNYGVQYEVYEKKQDEGHRGCYTKKMVEMYPLLATRNKSDGFESNLNFFRCSWTPRKPEDYLLSNLLCLHIKEMIELQNAIEVDNMKNVLILNKEDFKRTILNADVRPHIDRVWVNQNIIFSTEELKALKEIGYKYIPREFFGQELREAAE